MSSLERQRKGLDGSLRQSHCENLAPAFRLWRFPVPVTAVSFEALKSEKQRKVDNKPSGQSGLTKVDEVNSSRSREKDADVGCLLPRKHVNTVKNMATAREMTSPWTYSCDTESEGDGKRARTDKHETDKHEINVTQITACHNKQQREHQETEISVSLTAAGFIIVSS